MKIKYKILNENCEPFINEKGDWIDLRAAEDIELAHYQPCDLPYIKIKLGFAMQLPKGFEAIIAPRSSTFKTYRMMLVNSMGVIDYSYRGNEDYWQFHCIPFDDKEILAGDRICQFRIQLSQKATILQKLRWLFSNKIELIKVNNFNEKTNRGGFGTSGNK